MDDGKVTFKDSIEKKVFEIGKDYADSIDPAIEANQKWLKTFEPIKAAALEYANLEKQFKVSKGRKEFLEIKEKEVHLRKQTSEALKNEKQAYLELKKAETEKLKQDKIALDIEAKKRVEIQKTTKQTIEEKVRIQALNRVKREQAKVTLGLLSPYQKLSKQLDKARLKAKDIGVQFGITSKEFKKAQTEVLNLDNRIKKLDTALGQSQRFVGQYGNSLKGLRAIFLNLTSALGFTGGLIAFVQIMKVSFQTIRQFGKEMANLRAITKSNGVELEILAKKLGENTVFSANEAAKAMSLLGMAGYNTNQILKSTPSILDLAAAGGIGLAEAADIATNVLSGFGLKAEQTGMVVDILARTATSTNTTILTLGESFKEIAPTANNLKIPIEEVAAVVGLLGNSGIKGTDATTSLNTALNRLAKPTKEMKRKMRELNVEFFDSNGQFIGLSNMVELLNKRFVGLTDKQKAAAVSAIFGARANKQLTTLLNGQTTAIIDNEEVTLKGAEALQYLTTEYENASGAAKEMAETQLDSLDGALRLLKSAWEGQILKMDGTTGASKKLKTAITFLAKNLSTIITVLGNAVKTWLIYKGVLLATSGITKAYRLSTIALAGVKALLTGNVKRSTAALKIFKLQLSSTGIGAIVVLIGTLVASFADLKKSVSETVQETQDSTRAFLDKKKKTDDLNTEIEKLTNRYEELTVKSNSNTEGAKLNKAEQAELNSIIKQLNNHVPDAATEINEYGNALGINTNKVKQFVDESKKMDESLKTDLIKQTKQDIEGLKNQLGELHEVNNKVKNSRVKLEEGDYRVVNGILKKTVWWGLLLVKASEKEKIAVKQSASALQEKLKTSKALLQNLKGEYTQEQLNAIAAAEQAEKDKAAAAEQLKKDLARLEQQKIVARENEKQRKAKEELEKKLAKDAIELAKFVVQEKIKLQKEIVDNEDKTFESRKIALEESAKLELKLAALTAKGKFDITKGFSEKQIEAILADGQAAKKTMEKVGDEELLIARQYQAKKEEITLKKESKEDQFEVEKIKKTAEVKQKQEEINLNEELRRENKAFQQKEGLYAIAENAVVLREKRIAEIKKKYALEALGIQLKAVEELLKNEELSSAKRLGYQEKLSGLKLQISDLATENIIEGNEKQVLSTQEKAERIIDVSSQLAAALADLANSIFESKIQKIDEEINKNDEKYEKLLANENLSEEQRKTLEKQREKERDTLEKKKRKEQRKQAILNKAMAIVDIGIATAITIAKTGANLGYPLAIPFQIAAGVLGAVQTAAVIAKKIPQYAKGTDNHQGGLALVGEERAEVITEPGKAPYIVDRPTVMDLPTGTSVTPSLDEYKKIMRASTLSNIEIENKKLNAFQARQSFDMNTRALEKEMQLTRKAIEDNKPKVTVSQSNPIDFEHELFRLKNNDWNA